MDKYNKLWEYINKQNKSIKLSFEEINKIICFKLDHSFLKYKKVLEDKYIIKISLKDKYIMFEKR